MHVRAIGGESHLRELGVDLEFGIVGVVVVGHQLAIGLEQRQRRIERAAFGGHGEGQHIPRDVR